MWGRSSFVIVAICLYIFVFVVQNESERGGGGRVLRSSIGKDDTYRQSSLLFCYSATLVALLVSI